VIVTSCGVVRGFQTEDPLVHVFEKVSHAVTHVCNTFQDLTIQGIGVEREEIFFSWGAGRWGI
jgi:hypothetical protein